MRDIKIIDKHNWDFTLYEIEGERIIGVVFFGLVDFSRNFQLSEEEANLNHEGLKMLSERIRNDYESYKHREITIG